MYITTRAPCMDGRYGRILLERSTRRSKGVQRRRTAVGLVRASPEPRWRVRLWKQRITRETPNSNACAMVCASAIPALLRHRRYSQFAGLLLRSCCWPNHHGQSLFAEVTALPHCLLASPVRCSTHLARNSSVPRLRRRALAQALLRLPDLGPARRCRWSWRLPAWRGPLMRRSSLRWQPLVATRCALHQARLA